MKRVSRVLATAACAVAWWTGFLGCSSKNDDAGTAPGASCTANAQCGPGQACNNGLCVTPSPTGGSSGAAATGGSPATAGAQGTAGTPATGGSVGTGGMSGGSAGSAGGGSDKPCLTDPNLALDGGWIGCDPASTADNPMGLQGSLYMYHDGSTCTSPVEACGATGCCIKGATVVDSTFAKWGCGLGFELNSSGGTPSVKSAYTGAVKCFDIKLTGSSGGNPVRISYTQSDMMDGKVAPFLELTPLTAGWAGTVCFNQVTCPTEWMPPPDCMLGGPFDLQIQVVGGNAAGAFDLCLTELFPKESADGLSTLGQVCGIVGENEKEHLTAGSYRIQNNVLNASNGQQCITAKAGGSGAGFSIDSSSLSTSGNSPVAYPSVAYGWHFGQVTTGTGLPKALSAVTTAPSTVSYTSPPGGKFNAAYDIWAMPASAGANPATPSGGLEVMIWLDRGGNPNPIGTDSGQTLSVANHTFQIWTGTNTDWQVVTFLSTDKVSGWTGQDLKPFLQKAIDLGKAQPDWNLHSIQFGFEIWNGVAGGGVTSFSQSVP
jgi:hypothetical protein